MDRRETLKTLMVGAVAGTTVGTVGCVSGTPENAAENTSNDLYGRTPAELERDKALFTAEFFNTHEMATIAVLCDIILPASPNAGSATEAGVHEFVEFIVKDMPQHQLPLRGGLMWLDTEANKRYDLRFLDCSENQKISIVDDIAYGNRPNSEFGPGVKFFDLMRNLTLTGYYTSRMGIKDLGYKGNVPNLWDGVPPEVLAEHDVEYDAEWMNKFIDHNSREVIAEWDDDGNLLT